MNTAILAPAAVLVAWSLVMLGWMVATRFPAMKAARIDLSKGRPGGRGQDLDALLPATTNWKAHNYAHLMEQPTLFYAVVGILAIAGAASDTNVPLAWGYAALRIVHSIWQATVNRIPVRFALFLGSTLCLVGLAINALRASL
jgi:hypothetical protein